MHAGSQGVFILFVYIQAIYVAGETKKERKGILNYI